MMSMKLKVLVQTQILLESLSSLRIACICGSSAEVAWAQAEAAGSHGGCLRWAGATPASAERPELLQLEHALHFLACLHLL